MANVLTTNPIYLDTAGATSRLTTPLHIKAVRFVAAADADAVKIMNAGQTKIVYESKCKTPNFVENFTPDDGFDAPEGIYLTTLTSGAKVYLYV